MAADTPSDDLEASTDAVIAACDGDARAAVRALLVANSYLKWKLNVSKGPCHSAMCVAGSDASSPERKEACCDGYRNRCRDHPLGGILVD
jgi:hypothetical protein